MRSLRILTLNIWNMNQWRERRDEIAAWFEVVKPDIAGLQEVVRDDASRKCQARWIAERSGHEVAYAGGMRLGDAWLGNAILSRFPITGQGERRLPALDEPEEGRVCLRADLDTPRGPLHVYTTHLNWLFHHGQVREAQVQEIASFMGESPAGPNPPILLGDFNAPPDATEIRFLKGLHPLGGRSMYMTDAYEAGGGAAPGWTWDHRNPFAAATREPEARIDYIFVGWRGDDDGVGQVLWSHLVCHRSLSGTWATDHLGVAAEISYPC